MSVHLEESRRLNRSSVFRGSASRFMPISSLADSDPSSGSHSARSAIATRFSLVCLDTCWTGCSLT